MGIPSQQTVRETLEPYHDRIRAVVENAWEEWRVTVKLRRDAGISNVIYPRTVANNIFDAIARHAVKEFAFDGRVHIKSEAQSVKFLFKGGVLARFKKGNSKKLGQNIRTQANMKFTDPEELFLDLPPETAKIEFIWIGNDIQTQLEEVLVVARDGPKLLWNYAIEASSASVSEFVWDVPPAPDDGAVGDLVIPKRKKKPGLTAGE